MLQDEGSPECLPEDLFKLRDRLEADELWSDDELIPRNCSCSKQKPNLIEFFTLAVLNPQLIAHVAILDQDKT